MRVSPSSPTAVGLRSERGPVLGSIMSYFMFGGAFPGDVIIARLYMAHILLVPAILIGLFTAHLVLVMVHKHTQYPGPGRTNDNVVGFPVMPVYAAKAGGFFFIVFGIIALITGPVTEATMTIRPQPAARMPGSADRVVRNAVSRLRATAVRHCA